MLSISMKRNITLVEMLRSYYLVLLTIIILIVSSLLHSAFLTEENIMNVLGSNATVAMAALGMFFTILTGGIDLSIGSIIALSCCMLADLLQRGMEWWLAIIVSVVSMGIFGVSSGAMVAYAGIPPFMATLAMMTIVRGIAYLYQVGAPRLIFSKPVLFIGTGRMAFIPVPMLVLLAVLTICYFAVHRSSFGRKLYAIGGNVEAAFLSGVPTRFYVFSTYVISSVIAGLTGVVLGSRLMMGAAIFGQGYELDAIAAAVVGGTSLRGGSGTVLGVILGAFVLGFISNILNLLGVSSYMQMVVKGCIVIFAVLGVGISFKGE